MHICLHWFLLKKKPKRLKNKMNREQAAEKLTQGLQLKHHYFFEDEFIELRNDKILTEDGHDFTEQFWNLKQFEEGWEIYTAS